eukprot:224989_1
MLVNGMLYPISTPSVHNSSNQSYHLETNPTEEKIPTKPICDSKPNSSCTNTSSNTITYYPEPQPSEPSIISPNAQTPLLDRSYDPMDSISNIGSFYPALPNRSQSHSPQPTTTTRHKKDKNVNNQSYKRNRLLTPFSHRNKYHHAHQYRNLKSKYRKNRKKYKRKRRHPHMDYEDDIYDDEMYGYTTSSSHVSQMSVSSYESIQSNRSDSKRRKIKRPSNNFNAGSINSQTIESGGMNIQFVKNLNLDSANIIGLDSNKINKQNDNNNNNNIVIIINNHFQILK